jgi:L-histidine N-alpha-methyltransferase
MRLRSARAQTVRVADLDLTVSFAAGEEMRTEISAKFRPEQVRSELKQARLDPVRFWTDDDGDFGLTLARRR